MTDANPSPFALTILALHGNGGGGFRFARVLPHIPPDVRFEAITLPGFASVPADPALRTLTDYAAYVRGLLVALPRPRLLLGTGIGGSIILEYVQHDADTVDGVILHAPVGTRLESRRFPWLMNLPGMRRLGQTLFATPLARPLWRRLLFMDAANIPADYLNHFFDEYGHCAVFGQMFDLITPAWYASLQPRALPAALLWGERERVLKADHAGDYLKLLPNAQVRIVPGWDHFPMIEQPDEYAREVVALARELVRTSTRQAPTESLG
jgi:pimeloyl-ACP methyl ester carboxylesterase